MAWSGNGGGYINTMANLGPNLNGQSIKLRFRDWLGRYAMHCHNVIHEDHAMMLRFDVAVTGDTKSNP